MKNEDREAMLGKIRANIEKSGRHIYSVLGGESPRYLYTIGLSQKAGFEIILAGQATVPLKAAARLVNSFCKLVETGKSPKKISLEFEEHGLFALSAVDSSWAERMLFGAFDYYQRSDIRVMQIVPEQALIDTPPMGEIFDPSKHGAWKWLEGGWPHEIEADSVAITNLDALHGHAISEVVRWEDKEWEMFSGPGQEVPDNEIFRVPIATLVGFDASLEQVLGLAVGQGMFRLYDDDGVEGPWQPWAGKS